MGGPLGNDRHGGVPAALNSCRHRAGPPGCLGGWAIEWALPADYWRYFLLANSPESDDANFTWELFAAQVSKDLADTLGNFVHRVLTFSGKQFGNVVPVGGEPERNLAGQVAALIGEFEASLDTLQLRRAL